MFSCDDSMRTTSRKVEMHDVIDALLDSIAALPQRKDARADPIFEPHFKLLSVVHKLVTRGAMSVSFIPLQSAEKALANLQNRSPRQAKHFPFHHGLARLIHLKTWRVGNRTFLK
jgi:hypothetical protein